jgi:hypothetical protein
MYSYKKNLYAKVWAEYLCIAIQNLSVIFLYWYFEKTENKNKINKKFINRFFGISISLSVLIIGLLTDFFPKWIWVSLALTNIPFVLFSRIFQILSLLKTRNPGSLSASSFIMRYAKNFMQAFYLFIQVGDYILIFNQIYNGTLSLSVYVLIIYFTKKIEAEKNLKIV